MGALTYLTTRTITDGYAQPAASRGVYPRNLSHAQRYEWQGVGIAFGHIAFDSEPLVKPNQRRQPRNGAAPIKSLGTLARELAVYARPLRLVASQASGRFEIGTQNFFQFCLAEKHIARWLGGRVDYLKA